MARAHQLLLLLCLVGRFSALGLAQEPQSLGAIGVADGDGIRITEIIPGGPAETAGLTVGDLLTAIDGKPVKRIAEKSELMTGKKAGSQLIVTYIRGNRLAKATLVLGKSGDSAHPDSQTQPHSRKSADAPEPTVVFGITLGRPLPSLPACRDDYYLAAPEPPCKPRVGNIKVSESTASIIHPQTVGANVEYVDAVWERDDFCQEARGRLEAKFGKPAQELDGEATTGTGIEIAQTKTFWALPDSTALFLAPFSNVGDCWLVVMTPKWQKAHPQEKADF
jgi:membrane-associated protease RseP (regulator of RpoE activity)